MAITTLGVPNRTAPPLSGRENLTFSQPGGSSSCSVPPNAGAAGCCCLHLSLIGAGGVFCGGHKIKILGGILAQPVKTYDLLFQILNASHPPIRAQLGPSYPPNPLRPWHPKDKVF